MRLAREIDATSPRNRGTWLLVMVLATIGLAHVLLELAPRYPHRHALVITPCR